jgi:nucleotide-binding universal stress UspA family protein
MNERYGISIGRILHPTDFSHGSEVAFLHALRLCCATKGSLAILHVDPERRHPDWDKYPSVRETLSRWGLLPPQAERSDVAHLGVRISKSSVIDDDPVDGILQYLDQHPADLLVLATHQRHGLDRWLHKTIAGRINNRTDGAALFIPFGNSGFVDERSGQCRLKRILLPVDHVPDPAPAVEVVTDLIGALVAEPCEVRLLHVGDPAGQPGLQLPQEEKARWKWVTPVGSVVSAIREESETESVDLIVMTTSGRHGFFDALRGSTTEQIVEHAGCPVLAVHAWSD